MVNHSQTAKIAKEDSKYTRDWNLIAESILKLRTNKSEKIQKTQTFATNMNAYERGKADSSPT